MGEALDRMAVHAQARRFLPAILVTGTFWIDLTDERFDIPANQDVLEFVRRTNPFAHSDVGGLLLSLGKEIPGVHAYSPSFRQCGYVVLHTDGWRIFAIAFSQDGMAFRLAPASRAAALADGGWPAPEIGADWVAFAPWRAESKAKRQERLGRWCAQAFEDRWRSES